MMDLQDAIEYCLARDCVVETTPFGPNVLVYKVAGKMFATASVNDDELGCMNLKGLPDHNEQWRSEWNAIAPGYHMNKTHWNTITFDGSLPPKLVTHMIDESYQLVVKGLPKAIRETLKTSYS